MVRLDTLRKGVKFTDVSGNHYTLDRKHGVYSGVYIAIRKDERKEFFAGRALVSIGWI